MGADEMRIRKFVAVPVILAIMAAYGCGPDAQPHVLQAPVATAMPDSIPEAMLDAAPTTAATPTPLPTPAASPTPAPAPVPTATPIPSAARRLPLDVGTLDLFSGGLSGGAASGGEVDAASVEDVLDLGLRLAGASPVHIAFRGTAADDSVRCEWRGIARTPAQREAAIRFWLDLDDAAALPSPAEVERLFTAELERINAVYPTTVKSNFRAIASGGLSSDYSFLTCHVDYTVHEYLLGSGPTGTSNELTVAYDRMGESRSYDLYKLAHAGGEFGDELLMTKVEYKEWRGLLVSDVELVLSIILEGREGVVFLAPMGAHNAIAVEAWQAVAQWDVQEADDGTVNAVRYGTHESDPEHTQTLSALEARITAAVDSPGSGGARSPASAASSPTSEATPTRIANVSGLEQYYRGIGAYGDITPDDDSTATFTPADPPPAYAPAPASLTATASGEDGANLSWSVVTSASGYRVQHRIVDEAGWVTADATITGTSHTLSALWCGKEHEFRVGAYGDGDPYNTRAGLWSDTSSATMGSCSAQPPRFDASSYAYEVYETASVGDLARVVQAFDVNGDTVTHSITAGNEAGKFAIDADTGEITIAGVLDHETVSSYTLTVRASDTDGATDVEVGITVLDVNEAPEVGVEIADEEMGIGSEEIDLSDKFSDPDAGDTLSYTAESSDEGVATVEVSGGVLTITTVALGSTEVTVTATDTGRLTAAQTFTVTVAVASCSNGIVVPNPGSNAGLVADCEALMGARDTLRGTAALNWSYARAITGWEGITIAGRPSRVARIYLPNKGLTGSIAAELGRLPVLGHLTLNGNRLTGTIPASIADLSALRGLWLDDNQLTGEIPSTLGSLSYLINLSLHDNQLTGEIPGSLGNLRYLTTLILDENQLTGEIPSELGALGARLTHLYLASNSFTGCIPSALGDVATNDLSSLALTYCPEFGSGTYSFTVAENAAVDTVVGGVSATDSDAGDTLTYSIAAGNGDGKFALGSSTGQLTVAASLDHETVPSYTLTVEVSDGDGGAGEATVSITVSDVNEPPVFGSEAYAFSIAEDAAVDAAVGTVSAPDPDSGDALSYSITAGNSDGKFAIDSSTGHLAVAASLDHETAPSYSLTVEVSDGNGFMDEATVSITVSDVNEPPSFGSETYAFSVAEDAAVDAVVGTVSAADPDTGDTLSYSITAGNGDGKFAIDGVSGEITVAEELDYETAASYSLTVEAIDDESASDTSTVNVSVSGVGCVNGTAVPDPGSNAGLVGDCEALMSAKDTLAGTAALDWSYDTAITSWEGVTTGGTPSRVTELRFITRGLTGSIPPELGQLSNLTRLALRRDQLTGAIPESLGSLSNLTVLSLDRQRLTGAIPESLGSLPNLTWLRLTGNSFTGCIPPALRDVANNDLSSLGLTYCPEFGSQTYDFSVSEDASTGHAVGGVSATDSDVGDTLTYSIAAGNGDGKFTLGSSTGQLTVAASLDYETVPSYTLTVEVSDGNGGADEAAVSITVTDANEPPVFGSEAYAFSIAEDAAVSAAVGTVSAADPDSGDTATYSITAGNSDGKFALGPSTGQLTVAGSLDHETVPSYSLMVEASDGNGGHGRGGGHDHGDGRQRVSVVRVGDVCVFGCGGCRRRRCRGDRIGCGPGHRGHVVVLHHVGQRRREVRHRRKQRRDHGGGGVGLPDCRFLLADGEGHRRRERVGHVYGERLGVGGGVRQRHSCTGSEEQRGAGGRLRDTHGGEGHPQRRRRAGLEL